MPAAQNGGGRDRSGQRIVGGGGVEVRVRGDFAQEGKVGYWEVVAWAYLCIAVAWRISPLPWVGEPRSPIEVDVSHSCSR